MQIEKYGITTMNKLEKNVLEVALDHMQEHLEALIDFTPTTITMVTIQDSRLAELQEKLEACKNLKNSLK